MVKFRLSQKNNDEYLDLFPRTSVSAIANDSNLRGKYVIEVEVPKTANTTQTITIQTTPQIVDAPFEVHYVSGDKVAFNTISQAQVRPNALVLTRIHNKPEGAVTIALVFTTMGV